MAGAKRRCVCVCVCVCVSVHVCVWEELLYELLQENEYSDISKSEYSSDSEINVKISLHGEQNVSSE
jgi:hypothetical protein